MASCTSIFPLPFYRSDKYPFTKDHLKYIKTYRKKTYKNKGGNYITNESYVLQDNNFDYMRTFIQQQLDIYSYDILKMKRTQRCYVTQSWFNFNPKGSTHHMHGHPNSLISGTFYLQGEENTGCQIDRGHGNAVFPYMTLDVAESNPFNEQYVMIENSLHTLCLFPSKLQHEVEVNNNKTERITLAFNCYVGGTLGLVNHRSLLKL